MNNIEYWIRAAEIKKATDPYQDREEKTDNLLKSITENIGIVKHNLTLEQKRRRIYEALYTYFFGDDDTFRHDEFKNNINVLNEEQLDIVFTYLQQKNIPI